MDGKGWVPAGSLRAGDVLVSHDGARVEVQGIAPSGRVETVYNLEIEGSHTYFVGGWGWSAWAHNANESYNQGKGEPKAKDDAATAGKAAEGAAAGEAASAGKAAEDGSKVYSKEKQAIVDMAKVDARTGITKADMEAYKELNKQLPDPFRTNRVRGPESHPSRGPHAQ